MERNCSKLWEQNYFDKGTGVNKYLIMTMLSLDDHMPSHLSLKRELVAIQGAEQSRTTQKRPHISAIMVDSSSPNTNDTQCTLNNIVNNCHCKHPAAPEVLSFIAMQRLLALAREKLELTRQITKGNEAREALRAQVVELKAQVLSITSTAEAKKDHYCRPTSQEQID